MPLCRCKGNSVQEACTKCFAVHILKFEILQITWKKWNKEHQTLSFPFFTNRFSILMFFVLFFHVVCKISNFDKWTAKHLAKASTELTLLAKRSTQKKRSSLPENSILYLVYFVLSVHFLPTTRTSPRNFGKGPSIYYVRALGWEWFRNWQFSLTLCTENVLT